MINNLFAILIFGSLILLGIMLIINPLNVNRRANIWFGAFLFVWASFWLDEITIMVSGNNIEYGSVHVLNFIRFLSPIAFYFSIIYFTNPDYIIGKKWFPYSILPLIYGILLILDSTMALNNRMVLIGLLLIHGLAYIFLSLGAIRKHKREIQQFASDTLDIDLSWLEHIVWAALIIVMGFTIFNLLFFDAPLNILMNGFAYLIVLFTAFHSLKQKEIFPVDYEERAEALSFVNNAITIVDHTKILSDDKLVETKARLRELITNEELYLDSELNLAKLAKKLGVTSHQLSYVINNGYNQNFYSFINKFRVEKAKKLLANKELDRYSIIGIAFESGFNSKTAFNTTFKKITGQTPSEFKKYCSGL